MKLDSSISAIITGGASGLGAATARRLAKQGVKVAIFDFNEETGEAMAKEIGGVFCKTDVTDEAGVDAAFAKARAAHGQERILVNCAGSGGALKTVSRDKETGEIKAYPSDRFDRIVQINLVGTFRCIAKSAAGMASIPVLEDGDRGVVICTASVAAQDGQMGQVAYSASKAGIVGMTQTLAKEWGRMNTTVNCVAFGLIQTRLTAATSDNTTAKIEGRDIKLGVNPGLMAAMEQTIPLGRAGTPEDAAGAVYLFCQPESDYVSGQTLLCSGGLTGV